MRFSLALEDQGFDFSVLSEFRARLVAGGAEQRLFEALLTQAKVRGWRHPRVVASAPTRPMYWPPSRA
jgi:transposase